MHVQMRMLGEGEERALTSKLNLVDLAGSERTKKTGVTGQALKVEHRWLVSLVLARPATTASNYMQKLHQ